MARQTLESRYICSIYPAAPPSIKKYVGISPNENSPRCTTYELQAVPKGSDPGYSVCEVSDAFENIQDILGSTRKKRQFMSRLVPCERMVQNLLQEWAGNMVGVPAGIGPGIMEIANSVPTTKELARMYEIQNAFFEHMFAEGERLAANRQMKEITQPMILAAEWFDRKTTWATTTFIRMVPCPHCKQDIPPDATVCHVCQRSLERTEKAAAATAGANVETELAELKKQMMQLLAQQAKAPEPAEHATTAQPQAPRVSAAPPQPTHPKPLPTGPRSSSE